MIGRIQKIEFDFFVAYLERATKMFVTLSSVRDS